MAALPGLSTARVAVSARIEAPGQRTIRGPLQPASASAAPKTAIAAHLKLGNRKRGFIAVFALLLDFRARASDLSGAGSLEHFPWRLLSRFRGVMAVYTEVSF